MSRSSSPRRGTGPTATTRAAGATPQPSETAAVTGSFDGSPISAPAGASVAAALVAAGRTSWRTTRAGRQRGLFCGIGVCFDCLVEIDGQTGQRACLIPLTEGMDVRSHRSPGDAPPADGNAAAVPPTDRTRGGERS